MHDSVIVECSLVSVTLQMAINALIKKASIYAGDSDMDKVKACFDKCFVLESSCPDALIHRGRVSLTLPLSSLPSPLTLLHLLPGAP